MARKELTVGIVGAGIAGCCAAYFLRKAFPNARIVVYECKPQVGGRLQTATFAGAQVELGAAFMHSTNRVLIDLINDLSLRRAPPQGREIGEQLTVGIWNGRKFILRISGSGPIALTRLTFRYGLSLIRLRRAVRNIVARWAKVYELQARNHVFRNTQELLDSIGLTELAQESTREFSRKSRISARINTEICDPISRAIFNQNSTINAFAGAVALAGGGVGGGHVFSISGGNQRICEALLKAAGALVETSRMITELRLDALGSIAILDGIARIDRFDAVIIAVPLETAQIAIQALGDSCVAVPSTELETTYVTCVTGHLSPAYFGASSDVMPRVILTTESADIPFSAIDFIGVSEPSAQPIYKIQSRRELDDDLLTQLFVQRGDVLRVTWEAYPVLKPIRDPFPFVLHKGVYYVNAMESVVSTIETEAVASKNVVELMKRDYSAIR